MKTYIHEYDRNLEREILNLKGSKVSEQNKKLIMEFYDYNFANDISKPRLIRQMLLQKRSLNRNRQSKTLVTHRSVSTRRLDMRLRLCWEKCILRRRASRCPATAARHQHRRRSRSIRRTLFAIPTTREGRISGRRCSNCRRSQWTEGFLYTGSGRALPLRGGGRRGGAHGRSR